MIDVKDEILESEELFQLEDQNGRIILDNVRIKMKTPVIQEGTPVNKALFDSINNDILNVTAKIATGSIAITSDLQTIEVGFEPDLVICYSDANNNATIATSANAPKYYHIPRILTKAFYSENGYITENGFAYRASIISGSPEINYYMAVKF